MLVIAVATAAKAQEVNDALRDRNGGDVFQAGLVPIGSPPGTAPTHYHASWPEEQMPYLTHLVAEGKATDAMTQLRTERTTARLGAATPMLAFRADRDTGFGAHRAFARLGLQPV